jgi:phosphatidylglycerophosphatase A
MIYTFLFFGWLIGFISHMILFSLLAQKTYDHEHTSTGIEIIGVLFCSAIWPIICITGFIYFVILIIWKSLMILFDKTVK